MDIISFATAPLFVCFAIMLFAYVFAVKLNFYSIVDVVWAYSFTIVAYIYAAMPMGYAARDMLMLLMVSTWSVRLGTHLLLRLRAHYPKEDGRYDQLKSKWAKNLRVNFLLFFLFQGLSVSILSLPFLLVGLNSSREISGLEISGVLIWLTGIVGESVADNQLKKFRNDPANKGQVCEVGLWYYSRHPNYFFEWFLWVGYFVFALSAPNGWLGIASPLLMLYFLTIMTGVPYAEAQSLKSRGDLFRKYQKTTSVFVPWFKKKNVAG